MPAGKAIGLRRDVARAGGRIAVGPIAAAIACAPGCPALFKWRRRWRLKDRGISQRDIGGQVRLRIGRKADRLATADATTTAEAAVDERIEHQIQKLGHHVERAAFGIGCHLAGDLREPIGQIGAGQIEQRRHEVRRQRAAGIEGVVDGGGDVLLIGI